jgi:hypothetical protein
LIFLCSGHIVRIVHQSDRYMRISTTAAMY